MVFTLSIGYILRKLWFFKLLVYRKQKILVQWPKYVVILYNFDKYSHKIVQILCMLYEKLSNMRWKLPNTA